VVVVGAWVVVVGAWVVVVGAWVVVVGAWVVVVGAWVVVVGAWVVVVGACRLMRLMVDLVVVATLCEDRRRGSVAPDVPLTTKGLTSAANAIATTIPPAKARRRWIRDAP
jgi:hypothetical protein